MTLISHKYQSIKYLYNICDIRNLSSIYEFGILSKNEKQRFNISAIDISNPNVQKIRYCKNVSYNHGLHDYANLYFNPRNPMMYYLIHHNNVSDLCVICVDKRVLDLRGTFVSDRNAAS